MSTTGIDVSHHQGAIDWRAVARSGVTFAVVKATEGTGYVDDAFRRNVAGAHAAGLIVGAYHFARPGRGALSDAQAEARHFLNVTAGELLDFVALDAEADDVPAGLRLDTWVAAWLDLVEQARHAAPWVYSYAPWWREHLAPSPRWLRYPWWLADYSPPAASVAPWGAPAVHQWTSSGRIGGIAGRVDLNLYAGTPAQFRQLVGLDAGQPAPAPPTQEDTEPMIAYPTWGRRQPDGRLPMFGLVDVSDHACTVIANAGAPFAPGLDKVAAPHMTYGAYGLLSIVRIEGLGARPIGIAEAPGGAIAVGCADGGSVDVARKPA